MKSQNARLPSRKKKHQSVTDVSDFLLMLIYIVQQ